MKELKVPDIGDFDAVEVIEVLVSAGDEIEKEQPLITLESEKATMEVPATAAGKVAEVKVSEGGEVSEGDVILLLEEREEKGEDGEKREKIEEEREEEREAEKDSEPETRDSQEIKREPVSDRGEAPEPRPASTADEAPESGPESGAPSPASLPHASPAVRKYARELGVDLGRVKGSGPKERILKEDVQQYVKSTVGRADRGAPSAGVSLPQQPEVDFSAFGETETVELSRIRKLSARVVHRSWLLVPHVTQFDEADITGLEAFRQEQKSHAEQEGVKLTLVAFLLKAAAVTLEEFPDLNSSLATDGEHLIRKKYFHIGVAVDTDNGLVVPVIRDVDHKGVFDLARELAEVSERARAGKLGREDLQGGCFSISSLGGIGGTAFTPIVNAPEVAILGVSRARQQPVWNGREFKPRLMLPLSLSYDHRVIDGANAARITTFLADVLADIRKLLL